MRMVIGWGSAFDRAEMALRNGSEMSYAVAKLCAECTIQVADLRRDV